MNALRGMAWLLLFQSLGELVSHGLHLPLPGPVLGMVLLLGGLFHPAVRVPVAACADFLLSHLSLLFVPVGVGVMTHWALLQSYGVRILLAIVLSTWAGMAVTAWLLYAMREKSPPTGPARRVERDAMAAAGAAAVADVADNAGSAGPLGSADSANGAASRPAAAGCAGTAIDCDAARLASEVGACRSASTSTSADADADVATDTCAVTLARAEADRDADAAIARRAGAGVGAGARAKTEVNAPDPGPGPVFAPAPSNVTVRSPHSRTAFLSTAAGLPAVQPLFSGDRTHV